MKKSLPYILSLLLAISLVTNIVQFTASRNQATENAATISQLQTQLDSVNTELATITAKAEQLTLDYRKSQADYAALQAELEKLATPPPQSTPETTKPVTPPTKPAQPEKPATPPAGSSKTVTGIPLDDGSTEVSREDLEKGRTYQ